MCLDSIAKVPKKHKVGYKICTTRYDHTFQGLIFNTGPYELGKTYDAEIESCTGNIPSIHVGDGGTYLAGFHYYLRMKDAKKLCDTASTVVRIKVKDILATGKQNNCNAGVSRFMTLDRAVFDGLADQMKQDKLEYKSFLEKCKQPVIMELLKFAKRFKLKAFLIKASHMKELADFVSKSMDNFTDFIAFVDYFPRTSDAFKIYTKIHIWAYQHHKQYKSLYNYVIKNLNDPEFQKKLTRGDDYSTMVRHANHIDDIIMNKI